jgi:hypothetical protein
VDNPWRSRRTWPTEMKMVDGVEEDARKLGWRIIYENDQQNSTV